ncbi:unnamed protein product [Litomosoides sigmodontis]|uniref:Secreted protein n=1 Tax=Litomosoides sigmodontis TaxID=42156 RepID=A0A3P6TSQ4_LITSI|nr:unnamed protein product [Litomosoides sigmodontis]
MFFVFLLVLVSSISKTKTDSSKVWRQTNVGDQQRYEKIRSDPKPPPHMTVAPIYVYMDKTNECRAH